MTDLSSGAASAPLASGGPSTPRVFTLSDFDFSLPPELIAQHPAPERSASRLLDGRAMQPVDRIFRELPGLLREGDLLVFNDTRVVKARIFGEKASGGKLELLIERVLPAEAGGDSGGRGNEVVAHMKVSKKPLPGSVVHMAGGRQAGGFQSEVNATGAGTLRTSRCTSSAWASVVPGCSSAAGPPATPQCYASASASPRSSAQTSAARK